MMESSQSAPIYSIASTSSPAMVSVCANASGGIVMSTYSFSQLSGTFILLSPHHLVKNAGTFVGAQFIAPPGAGDPRSSAHLRYVTKSFASWHIRCVPIHRACRSDDGERDTPARPLGRILA